MPKPKTNSPTDPYDLIVIGAGSGGLSAALSMHELGFRVLLIDKSDRAIGGECLNDGCVPSKALIHVARVVHQARKATAFGLQVQGEVDMEQVHRYVMERQNIIREHENASHFRREGLGVALGHARFVDANTVAVAGQLYTGTRIVIATGSTPRRLDLPGVEQVPYHDNQSIFQLRALPKRLLVVGAGPNGVEMAQAFRRLGSEVSVVQRHGRIMGQEDPYIADRLQQCLEDEGILFWLGAEPLYFRGPDTLVFRQDGKEQELSFDAVFVAIGRELRIRDLDLKKAGIETEGGQIQVNAYLQTTNPKVYLCGDVAGSLKFSHAAEQHATLLVQNFLSPLKKKLNNDTMSWVTFTDPEVATFGLTEKQLKERNIKYELLVYHFEEDDRAVIEGYGYGRLLLFVEPSTLLHRNPKLLGGSMLAPQAGEMCQELILALSEGLGIDALFNKIYPYPTMARVNKQLIIKKKLEQLTPFIRKGIKLAYNL